MVHASLLDDRAVLALGGAEARDFLQGLITNDMDACREGGAIYAALLTPQGKILSDFFIIPEVEDRLLIDCAASRAADLLKRLKLYRLRANVLIALRPELAVAALWGEDDAGKIFHEIVRFADPRHPALGQRMIAERDVLARAVSAVMQRGDYHAHRLSLGIPDSTDLAPDTVFALDAGLEELNGVSFRKGCYIGQEVTARMKHRASARRRFLIAEVERCTSSPWDCGRTRRAANWAHSRPGMEAMALALVRLDRLAEAQEKQSPIMAAGTQAITLKMPGWFHG